MTTTIHICNVEYRDYTNWCIEPPIEKSTIHPLEYKLFHGDQFKCTITEEEENSTPSIEIKQSPIRSNPNIPGILLLENNRTYGRTSNQKRLYYKCRPYDTKLPNFLIPFDIPMGFNKNFKNKYVTFQYDHWNEKHPHGKLSQNLGDVHDFPAYCEYALYCKCLHESITKSITYTKQRLKSQTFEQYMIQILKSPETYGSFLKRDDDNVFSIDPEGCMDRDDALSIYQTKNTNDMCRYKVSVYIANVWVWLDALDLWDHIGKRISTIYFPIMKRPMLPTALGEQLCSLDQEHRRFGFVMDFIVVEDFKKGTIYIQDTETKYPKISQCTLTVKNNYDYEEPTLLANTSYQLLQKITQKLDPQAIDSHEVVAYWMMQMNHYAAKQMKKHQMGIYRIVQSKNPESTNTNQNDSSVLHSPIPTFVRILEQQLSGSYCVFHMDQTYTHETLGFSEYIHFTSPIRRMVDLLNQIVWVKDMIKPMIMSEKAIQFYQSQVDHLDKLNEKMKKIRRIQSDCDILYQVLNTPDLMQKVFEGMVVSIQEEKCGFYIEELKWLTQIPKQDTLVKYQKIPCKLYMFEKEEQMKRKIRVQLIEQTPNNTTE